MKHGALGSFLGAEQEHQVQFARRALTKHPEIEFFVFGHRHIPFDIRISETSRVICLGDWIGNFTYGVFDGEEFRLEKFLPGKGEIIKM
jgi:UDP-2,3-diacylglucosamine hydrolase